MHISLNVTVIQHLNAQNFLLCVRVILHLLDLVEKTVTFHVQLHFRNVGFDFCAMQLCKAKPSQYFWLCSSQTPHDSFMISSDALASLTKFTQTLIVTYLKELLVANIENSALVY